MLQQKREQFHKGLQRDERERLFQRIRLELLSGNPLTGTASQDGQQEILESIAYFRTQQQPLDFEAINAYICDFKGPFRSELHEQLVPLVLEKFPGNIRALACAANLLSKSEQGEGVVDRLDLREILKGLLRANEQEKGELRNGKPLAFLLYQILRLASDRSAFAALPNYYPQLLRAAGQFDVVTLLLLAEGSTCRSLLPGQTVTESYLAQDIPYERLNDVGVYKLYELVDNCLRFDEKGALYQPASLWIERRLRERAFPLTLKPQLVRLMTMMLRALETSAFLDFLEKLTVFHEIMFLARFGPLNCKHPALEFVAVLVGVAGRAGTVLKRYVEEHQLLEVMVYALELDLDEDLAFKMLTGLVQVLSVSRCHIRRAQTLGLSPLLRKFSDAQYHLRVAQAVSWLMDLLAEERNTRGL